jgi:hypothetical protein
MAKKFKEVPVDQLYTRIDPESLGFDTTEKLCAPEEGVVAQERAIEALKFGMGMQDIDYNISGPFLKRQPKRNRPLLIRVMSTISKSLIAQNVSVCRPGVGKI